FEAASGGTLFLDEIDALPPVLQGKLLTALGEEAGAAAGRGGGAPGGCEADRRDAGGTQYAGHGWAVSRRPVPPAGSGGAGDTPVACARGGYPGAGGAFFAPLLYGAWGRSQTAERGG